MALTVETGVGVTNADSYVSLVDARVYASTRGIVLNVTDATAEVQLRRAFDYLESFRNDYRGVKAVNGQVTQWPRSGADLDGEEIASNIIPTLLKNAQVYVAAAIESGLDPSPNATGTSFVVSEKVGPIETKYSEAVNTSGVPILRTVEQLLTPLLVTGGFVTTVRA